MAVPTKEAGRTEPRDGAAPELSSIQFSAQFTEEITESQEPQPDTADIPETPGIPGMPDMPGALPEDDILSQAELAQQETARRDQEILDALDKVLQQTGARSSAPRKKPQKLPQRALKFTMGTVKSGAGLVSLALTLVFLGIVTMCVLLSGSPDFLLIAKLAPISAVFVGAELLLSWFVSGRRLRIHVPCVCITAAVAVAGCILSTALNREGVEIREEQSGRVVAAQIYQQSYKELCRTADISTLTVNADLASGADKSWDTLSEGDIVDIAVEFSGTYSSAREFAQECRTVIAAYKSMSIPVSHFSFVSDSRMKSFRLEIDGLFQQDKDVEELTEMVNYISYEDYDYIEDLEDFTAEATETHE